MSEELTLEKLVQTAVKVLAGTGWTYTANQLQERVEMLKGMLADTLEESARLREENGRYYDALVEVRSVLLMNYGTLSPMENDALETVLAAIGRGDENG